MRLRELGRLTERECWPLGLILDERKVETNKELMAQMRAARIVAPRAIRIEEVSIPQPSPSQVRFRVEGCGVCASNLGQLTDGKMCDRVVEAVGAQWPLDLAAELTKERGTLVIAGYHQDGPRQVNMQLWNWRGFDVVNAHERNSEVYVSGIQNALEAVEHGRLDPKPLVTHASALDELGSALDATAQRPDGFLKAWVSP
jgi:threonine dehydrogenase-like Zn-dependent dehydrogenase